MKITAMTETAAGRSDWSIACPRFERVDTTAGP
jgi:hypothetical protein